MKTKGVFTLSLAVLFVVLSGSVFAQDAVDTAERIYDLIPEAEYVVTIVGDLGTQTITVDSIARANSIKMEAFNQKRNGRYVVKEVRIESKYPTIYFTDCGTFRNPDYRSASSRSGREP